jgi:hypothetical protein
MKPHSLTYAHKLGRADLVRSKTVPRRIAAAEKTQIRVKVTNSISSKAAIVNPIAFLWTEREYFGVHVGVGTYWPGQTCEVTAFADKVNRFDFSLFVPETADHIGTGFKTIDYSRAPGYVLTELQLVFTWHSRADYECLMLYSLSRR